MNEQTKQTIMKVISCFENSTPELQYDYVEALGDGRGFTSGIAGFTTSDLDALYVILRYNKEPMTEFIPVLKSLGDKNSGSTLKLRFMRYASKWKQACLDKDFRDSQDSSYYLNYFVPAIQLSQKYGITSSLGYLIFVDTCVQHGFDGPDSLSDIASRAEKEINVGDFLHTFLRIREQVLQEPQDPNTKDEWSQSVGRVFALRSLLDDQSYDLWTPFKITVFGDTFTIE